MRELQIERRRSVWPLVLMGIAVAGLAFYLIVFYNHDKEVEQAGTANLITVNENNSAVAGFVSFVENDDQKMSLDHAYTNDAMLKLTSAIQAMADEIGYDVRADLNRVDEHVGKITTDPFETTHADNIRKAADICTVALQNMQTAKYPGLTAEALEVKNASALINPDVLTLEQKDFVKAFFSKAADLLKKMN